MTEPRIERIGDCILYLGDCYTILPIKADAVLTDPPYGIGAGSMNFGKWRTSEMPKGEWDSAPADVVPLVDMGCPAIIWGGNYFSLPPSRCFLIWNKGAGFKGRDFAECEMAWTNIDANAREITHDPLASGDYRHKQHPTQKPVRVMEWCLTYLKDAETILDPFMGSGTTGVACARNGRKFVGIEAEPRYFDMACERIAAAYAQGRLFA